MLSPYDHEAADLLAASVEERLPAMTELRDRAQGADDTLLMYVNDNHDRWEAGRQELVADALEGHRPDLAEPIAPREPVPFVTKGRHSIFYQTPLAHLLSVNHVERVVLCGQVTEQCILYSALDARMHGYEVVVPPDAVAHIDEDLGRAALRMMERNLHAELAPVADGAQLVDERRRAAARGRLDGVLPDRGSTR